MATKRERSSGSFEYVVKNKRLLPRPLSLTFTNEKEGDEYVRRLEAMLDRGIVPPEFAEGVAAAAISTVDEAIREYLSVNAVAASDKPLLSALTERHRGVKLVSANYAWLEAWITKMKRKDQLAPGTIRHYVGALGRVFDWCGLRNIPGMIINPVRQLRRGYANYTDEDGRVAGAKIEDVQRDRRLAETEEQAIDAVLKKRDDPAERLLFTMALESAMRLREMYTLTLDQVDFAKRTIFLERTKNGDKRQVPMTSVLRPALKAYLKRVKLEDVRLFPQWWDGSLDKDALNKATAKVSAQFGRIFEEAGCGDFHFHDARHEATSRFFERTELSDMEISKITGHKDWRSLARYANLRGSNLAGRLW